MEEKLFYTIESGDYRTLRHLIHQGVNANTMFYGADPITKSQWSALHLCCEKGRYECAKVLLEGKPGFATLMTYYHLLRNALITTKSTVDFKRKSSTDFRYKQFTILPTEGAFPDSQDKWNQTPLMYSVCGEWPELTQLLITFGSDVNCQDKKGRTAAHVAVNCSDNR